MMKRQILGLLRVAVAALFLAGPALAQNAGTVTNHAFALGKGPGTTGFTSLLCASAQLAVGQSAADPICKTITGDVTISATGATAIGSTVVHSSMLNADVFSTAHSWGGQQTFVAPILGTIASGDGSALTGTASSFTAGHVTTNANLTGPVTSVGNATTIGAGQVTYANLASAALATAAQYIAATANTVVPASVIYTAETATTFGATTTFDFSTFINTAVTLTGNITTMTLSNVKAGQAGSITFIQDGTGSRTTVWNSIFKFAGGVTPTLSTAAGAIDVLFYSCRSATVCPASLVLNMK